MNIDQTVAAVFGNTDDATKAVDHVFTVLAATYGSAWDRSLGNAPISDIKTAWAFQLSQFTHSTPAKRSILWALRNLPDTVPRAIDFRNLCRQAPEQEVLALANEVKADPERVREAIAKLTPASSLPKVDFKAWARKILADHATGFKKTPTVLQMARNAVGAE